MTSLFRYSRFLWNLYKTINNTSIENISYLKIRVNECGPLGLKLLQFMIMNNILKTKELDFCLENCDIHSFEDTCKIYKKDYGIDIKDHYNILSTEPIGSGSIGQVYCFYNVRLRKNVALKIKHPDIDNQVKTFTKSIKLLISIFGYFISFKEIINEFIDNINLQLNYYQEAMNTILLKNNFINENIIVPEIINVTENIIIMTYHEGKSYNELSKIKQINVSFNLIFIYLSSVLVYDWLHGDLHTGNFKINGDKIIIYDCGIMCSTKDLKLNKELMTVILNNNYEKLINLLTPSENYKKIENCVKEINGIKYKTANDRLQGNLRIIIKHGLFIDKNIIHILNAIAIFSDILKYAVNTIAKFVYSEGESNAIMLYTYISLLEKTGSYIPLKNFLKEWMDSDPQNASEYNFWLMDQFGHTRSDIIAEIIINQFKE
jgi:predicted unusual protein kinase regulating ubiquinone biosynthesis (AarF/ABC1/UbiB family)